MPSLDAKVALLSIDVQVDFDSGEVVITAPLGNAFVGTNLESVLRPAPGPMAPSGPPRRFTPWRWPASTACATVARTTALIASLAG